ncbi:AAA family ATPase [Candidatus Poribacteria bacterium]|nr:AAA family ATPase [Candidatus Poribacteria bacterium]
MKICRLKLKNLNSFREEIDIDFEGPLLGDTSLVAITGPTGAGKTTLLDAICVALYGKTPRLSGTGSQHPRHLISHGEKEGFAEVHFIAKGTVYIASWSIRRRGAAEVRLSYAEDGKVISDRLSGKGKALGPSQRTVSEEVESLLGLDFGAFRRSVMLAQGEFAAFLKASRENRRTILEATAGIDIYEILKDRLNEKVAEVEAANADVVAEIEKIPEASPDQLGAAETELDGLKNEANLLETQSREIQQEKIRETKRKEDYEKLQSSEERQVELSGQQQGIDALQAELENAQRAERLRPEKQIYDAAKSDLQKAKEALDTATAEKTDAEKQVETDKANFDRKEEAYQIAATAHIKKTDVYADAKLDVGRATNQFAEAENRTPKLSDLNDEIDTLSDELANKETEQTGLQKQIKDTQTFLDENPLPSDRQHRLTQANVLSTQLDSQQKQLETALANEVDHGKKIVSLKHEIKELSEIREERLAEKTNAKSILETATAELNKLLAVGTREEWITQKQQASEALPVAQKYETAENDLVDAEGRLRQLKEAKADLDAELEQIDGKLAEREGIYQRAAEAVQRCEEKRELALLANPINKLRQRLQPGEPCQVCGSTDHSFVHIAESEDDNLLQNAENALKGARAEAKTAQDQMQALKVKQGQTQQNRHNTNQQIKDCEFKIETLQDDKVERLAEWQGIYPDEDISSHWAAEQIESADAAIAALGTAEKAQTTASHAYNMVAQQLETCETDIAREEKSLNQAEKQLQDVKNTVSNLQVDVDSIEERFWEFLPETFHGVTPDVAVDQFDKKIEEVETRKDKLDTAETDLKLLNANIETDRRDLKSLSDNRENLQDEIDEYRREGKRLLDTVRGKTGGLETEAEIDAAIDKLEVELQAKEDERDEAQQQLQESINLSTQKQTAHGISERQHKEAAEKLERAQKTYFDKLEMAGFDSPEAQDNAFRDDVQLQEITAYITDHEDEKQQLQLTIADLKGRFEETPFDPKALARIEAEAKEIGEHLQIKQQEVGAQQQRIDDLKDALEKREALGGEIAAAEAELMRWKRLQETIPRNDLRDFALEIMFRQMGSLANEQLKYLTSERYQLKVETIGDLSVIDRWNANEARPVETLSGGESFLTSLALALALADLSRGRAQLNSLFLDEGFGTLDRETLDVAISALEGLRMQGRSIFLISHVQELTRRIPVKINVRKRGDGSSSVQVQG